ncbi:MAG: roadblock/LC7 domain-containing protein [Candidatus Hodarchaeales archaeon]
MIRMDVSQAINQLLVEMAKSITGLKQVMLSDSTGLVISKVTKERDSTDFEGIASISTALYLGMTSLDLGELGFSQSVFSGGKLILFGISKNYVLVVITNRNTSIKKLRYYIEKVSNKISEQLDLLHKSEQIERKQEEISKREGFISDEELSSILDELSF